MNAYDIRKKYGLDTLVGADLSDADLSGAILSGAILSRADFSGADLGGADLSDADLSGAILSGAILSRADFSGADLSGADLSGADLSGADFSGAVLSGADLSGAVLIDAKNVVDFTLGCHYGFFVIDSRYLKIGCVGKGIEDWTNEYVQIGQENNYSKSLIELYGNMIKFLINNFPKKEVQVA